jgi:hypothetical protein
LFVKINADVGEAACGEKAGDELPDRVCALAEGGLAALADELEASASDDFVNGIIECERNRSDAIPDHRGVKPLR